MSFHRDNPCSSIGIGHLDKLSALRQSLHIYQDSPYRQISMTEIFPPIHRDLNASSLGKNLDFKLKKYILLLTNEHSRAKY